MDEDSEIKILSEEVDYASPPMNIIRLSVQDSKGKVRPYWMLDRKNDFSIIIPIFTGNNTVLVGQYRVPIRKFSWEFSMGTVSNATPRQTAEQELREETGLTAKKWQKIGEFFLAPGISNQKGHVFTAEDLTEGDPMPEDDEEIQIKKVGLSAVGNMIKNQEIKDGPSIIAWQFLQNN